MLPEKKSDVKQKKNVQVFSVHIYTHLCGTNETNDVSASSKSEPIVNNVAMQYISLNRCAAFFIIQFYFAHNCGHVPARTQNCSLVAMQLQKSRMKIVWLRVHIDLNAQNYI